MIGGLGGFVLPIAFGFLKDMTGLWTSCFLLLFLIVHRLADLDAPLGSQLGAQSAASGLARLRPIRRALSAADNQMTEKLVVVGNGMAPGRCSRISSSAPRPLRDHHLRRRAAGQLRPDHALAGAGGEKTFEDIVINDEGWYRDNGIALHTGRTVVAIDRAAKTVDARGRPDVAYDKLILATGSDPFRLPLPGADLKGVVTFRDLDDVEPCARPRKPAARRW